MPSVSYAVLDEALERLTPYGPALSNGNFNHAPMVAEALCAAGRPEAVLPWIDAYQPRLVPRLPATSSIDPEEWRTALGRRDAFAAWSDVFAEELRAAPWQRVLDRWAARLAPGLSGAAAHGVIRTGHAVRALAETETEPRRHELADALASWAASYTELPGTPPAQPGRLTPKEALRRLTVVPVEQRRPGNIAAALGRLGEFPDFAAAIGLIDVEGDPAELVAALADSFARVYLANVSTTLTVIAFVHGVTAVHAIGNIAPWVDAATARRLALYGWQAGCGLYTAFGTGTGLAEMVDPGDPGEEDADTLFGRAVANGDEHAIKFAEACLYHHARRPSPAYPAAVCHVLGALGRR